MASNNQPIIVLAGQTGSGKSACAMKLAEQFGGEIICADSRTIYRGMDIGTAKPSDTDRERIPHHGLDLVDPSEGFSAAEFQRYTKAKVHEIHDRNRVPFVVGGSGLYIDGFVYDFSFAPKVSEDRRRELEALSLEALQHEAQKMGIDSEGVNYKNPRHLARAIERGDMTPRRREIPNNILYIGLSVDWGELKQRLRTRVVAMFEAGLVDEVERLVSRYGADAPGLLAPGYKAVCSYIAHPEEATLEAVKEQFVRNDIRLAKRQKTWFSRNKDIVWVTNEEQAIKQVAVFLTKFDTMNS